MSLWLIELDDADIRVWRDGELVDRSPGIALVQGRQITTGAEAASGAHLNPRHVYNRYFQQLNEAPLTGASRHCRHHADLAFHHLAALSARCGQPGEAVFAVPAHYGTSELALLLGICGALKLKVAGLVDLAVGALAGSAAAGRYCVVDVYQHHVTLSEIDVGDRVQRRNVDVIDQSGHHRVTAATVDLIADAFLEQSRFDPLHEAATEQLLHTNLPRWLAELGQASELEVAIDYHGTRFVARVATRDLERVTGMVMAPVTERLRQGTQVVLTAGAATLPGFRAMFDRAEVLPLNAVADAVAEHRLAVGAGGEVSFVTELPATAEPNVAVAAAAAPVETVAHIESHLATHLLSGHHADAITGQPLSLAAGAPDVTGGGANHAHVLREGAHAVLHPNGQALELNGAAISDTCRLRPGDVIRNGAGTTWTAISVTNST